MIIDADVHISPFEERWSIHTDELIRRMDYSGVDRALTWLQPAYFRETDAGNKMVNEAARNYPDRILGFGWVDPHHGLEAGKETIKRCLAKSGKMLAFHVGADAFEATHPFRLAKIARRFPETEILLIHLGGVGFHDLSDAAVEVALQCPNITVIGSAVRAVNILKAVKRLGAKRVCFGSDTPFAMMHVELAMYEALLRDEVTKEEKSWILGGNIARLFDL
jgi:predicted TIM-barrel fold metal-dependent hydrolase